MKILLFIDSLGAGGAQRQFVGLANMLQEHGHNINIILYHKDMFYEKDLNNNISVEIIPKCSKVKRLISYYKITKRLNPEWIIAYQETPSIMSCIIKIINNSFKLLVSERNTSQNYGFKESIRFTLFKVANVIVPNSFSQELFIKQNKPSLGDRVKTIPNFVDLDYFYFNTREKHEVPLIIIVASIWPPKNTLRFIEAVSIAVKKGYKFKVKWYGIFHAYQNYLDLCENQISKYEVSDYIELCHKSRDIRSKYFEADLFCLPSYYEGTPNVICEAISTGLPVLCSDVCDNHIYVHPQKNGFLFNPTNAINIADTIIEAVNLKKDSYDTFSVNSRKIAESLLGKDKFISNYLSILEN